MKRLSATSAALTAGVLAVAVALPASASTGTGSGGASGTGSGGTSATPPEQQQQSAPDSAGAANYKPVKATWYGPGLYGRKTACGAKLTHNTLGVANKRLPCGTQVALRLHGRTVVVPVIDRGPYSRGVDYDLTYATAQKLGMTQTTRLAAAALR
jgi:rare lipoprotein A